MKWSPRQIAQDHECNDNDSDYLGSIGTQRNPPWGGFVLNPTNDLQTNSYQGDGQEHHTKRILRNGVKQAAFKQRIGGTSHTTAHTMQVRPLIEDTAQRHRLRAKGNE